MNFSKYSFEELCTKKQNKEIDISWEQIAVLHNLKDKEQARQKWKRMRSKQGILPKREEMKIDNIDNKLSNIELEKINLKKERIKIQDQRRELNKLIRKSARFEYLIEYMCQIAEEVKAQKPLIWEPLIKINSDKEGVLLTGDWHANLETNNFLNIFNKNEFKRRINRLVMKTIEHGKTHNIKVLHVFNLGDQIAGIIHTNARIQSNEDNITQLMYISEIFAEILCKFANEFEEIRFYSVIDNHSRLNANKDESIEKENLMRLLPWYLKTRLSQIDNIKIIDNELDEEFVIVDICGYKCLAVHGHYDKVENVVQNLSLMTKQNFNYVFMGHYHHDQQDEIHSCEVIVNPSLAGTESYAKKKRKSSKPAQKFMVFNEEEGRELTYNIRLDI